jgi:hypothetical protein
MHGPSPWRRANVSSPLWEFVGAVGSCVDRPPIPADLRRSYEDALRRCAALARALLVPGATIRDGKGLLTALAGLGGHNELAALLSSIDDELTLACPACGEQTYVELANPPFGAPLEPPDPAIHAAAAQARVAGLDGLAVQIEALDSAVACASCGSSLSLAESVAYPWP